MITNQLKENIIQGWLLYVIRSFLQVAFVFSFNSLILSSFPLPFFHLAETSLCFLVPLYSYVCSYPKYHEMSFIHNYSPGADTGSCHCCQCSTPKRLTLISRLEFSFLKMSWIRFSDLSESNWGRHCGEMSSAGGTFFHIVPFLIQIAIPCNVLSVLTSSDN